jgi:phage tail-like protein
MTFAVLGTHTKAEWREWRGENVDVTEDGVVLSRGLTPTYVNPVELAPTLGDLASADATIVDVTVDDCDTLYALTASGGVYRDDRSDGVFEPFVEPRSDDETDAVDSRAIAVTDDTVYAGSADGTVVAVSRTTGEVRWTETVLTDPVGMSADHQYAYVLDERPEGGVVFRFGRGEQSQLQLLPDLSGTGTPSPFPNPLDITLDDRGHLYVLYGETDGAGGGPSRFLVDRFERSLGAPTGFALDPVTVEVPSEFGPTRLEVVGVGEMLFAPGPDAVRPRTLVRYLPDSETFERVSTFEGTCEALALRRGEANRSRGLYVLERIDESPLETTLWFFEEVRTNSRSRRTEQFDARLVRRFDAGREAVEWHRVEVEFALAGAGTQVRLHYVATDDVVAADAIEWRTVESSTPRDTLLDDANGRYLWVRIDLVGTETTSPTVSACRVYLPRTSYLRYLPALYREDPTSEAFLEQFLSVFESVFHDIEVTVDDLPRFLDVEGIDAEYLDWLESWLALDTDESWTEASRRELLRRAPTLFRGRGTRAGLLDVLEIYLRGVDVPQLDDEAWKRARNHEQRLLDSLVEGGTLGVEGRERRLHTHESLPIEGKTDPIEEETARDHLYLLEEADLDCVDTDEARETYRRLLPCPHCFVVLVAPYVDDERVRGVDRIVRAERPAHAVGRGVGLSSSVDLGGHSYLGVNSSLSAGEFRLEQSSLGRDSALADPEYEVVSGEK